MPDTPQQNTPSDKPLPPVRDDVPLSLSDESSLKKITQQMYIQNTELAIKNKTLSVLRTLYNVTTTSLSVQEVSQKIVDAMAHELGFSVVTISLLDENGYLKSTAITHSPIISQFFTRIGKRFEEFVFNKGDFTNIMAVTLRDRQRNVTGNLLDLLTPHISQEDADAISTDNQVRTFITYPIVLGQKDIGIMSLWLTQKADDLSRMQKETLQEIIDLVAISIDRAQIYENLKIANIKLKELDKLKDDFVSVTSHELRTPMTAIKSYVWMILNNKGGTIEPITKEYLNRVYISTDRLITLVNDMLNVSRIESGRIQLNLEPLNIILLNDELVKEFQARAMERHITLQNKYSGTIPTVKADKEKIHQILENLIGNAFKFVPDGGSITVTTGLQDNMVRIAVSDTGKGIDKKDFPKLFTKFSRVENSLVSMSDHKGTGLGLFICKQFIELHQGSIWVESEVGKGTTFTFTLPVSDAIA